MSTSLHIANPRAASQYLGFSECVHTFSMDNELRNDRIQPSSQYDAMVVAGIEKISIPATRCDVAAINHT